MVSYQAPGLPTHREHFAAISVTGRHCDLKCDHCQGKLLESMIPAQTPETFLATVDRLRSQGGLGLLLSGGADRHGEVPLERYIPAIRIVKEKDPRFKIIVHTGLIRQNLASDLKEAGVDQVLIDVIGDEETIHQVYHLDRHVKDYEETLAMLKETIRPSQWSKLRRPRSTSEAIRRAETIEGVALEGLVAQHGEASTGSEGHQS